MNAAANEEACQTGVVRRDEVAHRSPDDDDDDDAHVRTCRSTAAMHWIAHCRPFCDIRGIPSVLRIPHGNWLVTVAAGELGSWAPAAVVHALTGRVDAVLQCLFEFPFSVSLLPQLRFQFQSSRLLPRQLLP